MFRAVAKRAAYGIGRMFRETGLALDARGSQLSKDIAYLEPLSRHRSIMALYDLSPMILMNTYIAPNATVVGEVMVGAGSQIWYGAVVRGDLNAIRIGNYTTIGDNTVIHTASALPTGIPASVNIGNNVNIQNGCTLYSCTIDDEVQVGFKSIILEGAKIERGAMIAPNSVVPPGRLIPAQQLWAGNPVEYVRDLTKADVQWVNHNQKRHFWMGVDHKYEFLGKQNNYLLKENSENDLHPRQEELRDAGNLHEDLKNHKN